MANCPYCNAEIIAELNFCIECEKQVRCLNCDALLYKSKSRCLKCGELVHASIEPTNAINSFTFEEKITRTSSYRRVDARGTDNAANSLAVLVASTLPLSRTNPLHIIKNDEGTTDLGRLLPQILEEDSNDINADILPQHPEITIEQDTKERLDTTAPLFLAHAEYTIIPTKTLRDYITSLPTKKEKQVVFILLYVWHLQNREGRAVKRDELIEVMKYERLYDKNSTRRYLGEIVKNYFVVIDDGYRVNGYDGEVRVRKILEAIQNPESEGMTVESKRGKKGGRPEGSPNKKELEEVKPWIALSLDALDNFDVRKLESAVDWAVFAIYLLTKQLKVQDAVKPGVAYTFLAQKYPVLSVRRKTFVDALFRDKKNVSKSITGAYSLTKIGEQRIDELINSEAS